MKALFVTRHNNDFDSIAPVADGWAKRSDGNASDIFVSSPELAWKGDYRTAMLARRPGVDVTDIWQLSGRPDGLLERLWRRSDASAGTGGRIARKALQIATESAIASEFDAAMTAWLDKRRPDIIAFDWVNPPSKRKRFGQFGYQAMTAWARNNSVPLVSLPHGLLLFDPPKNIPFLPGPQFAATFVESEARKRTMAEAGVAPERIKACGAPRYDPSWVERVVAELGGETDGDPAGEGTLPPEERVRIVFFATKKVYDFDFAGLMAWLAHLAAHPRVDLVIQPHPRGQRPATFAALARLPNVTVDARTPASLLIDRAAIVSTLVSSVMVEAVLRGREILYPKFVNTVSTRFEEAGACVALEAMEATHPAIDAFVAGKRVARENYDRFLRDTVFGGGGPDTIARICDEMARIAENPA